MARRKLIADSRGFSSIVGAVFAVLIMISLISTAFVWSLSQNSLYNNAVRTKNQLDAEQSSEEINAFNASYTVSGNTVSVSAPIQNLGSLPLQITRLWLRDINSSTGLYGFSNQLSYIVQPGTNATIQADVVLAGVNSVDNFTSWLVTGRGNVFATSTSLMGPAGQQGLQGPAGPPGSSNSAMVAQGIGSISMDFSSFSHYDNVGLANGTSVGSAVYGYTISGSINTLLHVNVTNYDLYNRTLTLTGGSMWAITPFSGTLKGDQWKIANVTNGKLITIGTYRQVINLNQTVDLYFGPETASRSAGNIVPLFILLYGQAKFTNGTIIDYGQNLPFIALNVT
jgi:hypothetical protein